MENPYVFISYKVEEFTEAKRIKSHLEANDIPCWMAPMSIRGGMSYAQEIPPAIQNCCAFVLILSQKAQESKWVPRELDQAINCNKVILPYMTENCPLKSDFSFYLTNVQRYEAFREPEEALARMTRDIRILLGLPPVKESIPEPSETPSAPATPTAPKVQPPKDESSVAKPALKKSPSEKKSKSRLPLTIITSVIIGLICLFLFKPGQPKIAGTKYNTSTYYVKLENVTLTQTDIDQFLKLTDLNSIHLENCTIEATDLSPLLTDKIYLLRLPGCNISNEQFSTLDFSGATHLRELIFSGSPNLTTIPSLDVCSETLTLLDISDTDLQDFGWIAPLTKLKTLRADRTGLQDTSPIESMIYLEELSLSDNGITSLDGLKNTSKLTKVDLSHNDLTDVSALSRSSATLKVLHLEYNALTDLRCLSDARSLTKVYIDENRLTSLDWLRGNSELQILTASHNEIASITNLGIGEKLRYLNLSHNRIRYVSDDDLVFGADTGPVVDLSYNQLCLFDLSETDNIRALSLLGNPELTLSELYQEQGNYIYLDFNPKWSLESLQKIPFTNLCIVNCTLDRQVEIEEGLSNERLMTEEDAIEEIAHKGALEDY